MQPSTSTTTSTTSISTSNSNSTSSIPSLLSSSPSSFTPTTLFSSLTKKTSSFLPTFPRSNSSKSGLSILSTSPSSSSASSPSFPAYPYIPKSADDPPPFKSMLLSPTNLHPVFQQQNGKDDAISSITCLRKYVLIGTHWGHIHWFELPNWNHLKKFTFHRSSVTDLTIEKTGEYFASVGLDARLVIALCHPKEGPPSSSSSLNSSSNSSHYAYEFRRPLKCIQFDPDFIKTKRLVVAGHAGEVVCVDLKQWKTPKKKILTSNVGGIITMLWTFPSILVYATDESVVEVYDFKQQALIHRCILPTMTPRADAYKCFFLWKDQETLVVAWNQTFQILLFKLQSMFEAASKPQLLVHRTTNFITGGIHFFGDVFIVFALPPSQTAEGSSDPVVLPSIVIFDPFQRDPILSKTPFDSSFAEDASLPLSSILDSVLLPCLDQYMVSTSKHIWSIQPMLVDDRIEWFLQHGLYERALHTCLLAQQHQIPLKKETHQIHQLGPKVLHALLPHQVTLAASLTPLIFDHPSSWEEWVKIFAEHSGLDYLLKYLPTDPPLDIATYDYILEYYLHHDVPAFRSLIFSWPPHLFNYDRVLEKLEEKIANQPTEPLLLNVAINLYRQKDMYLKEFSCHLKLKNLQGCLELLKIHKDLLPSVLASFSIDWFEFCLEESNNDLMMMVDSDFIHLLLENIVDIKPEFVLSHITKQKKFQFVYLYALFRSDPSFTTYHPLLLELLVQYQPDQLYSFLTQSIHYPLDKALEFCIEKKLVMEQVYVLGRMGNKRKALTLLLDKYQDMEKAIQYVRQQEDDVDLWEDVLTYAQRHPHAWAPLFQCHCIDPIVLLKRVPPATSILGLHSLLISFVQHYEVQLQVRQQCHTLQTHDHLHFIDQCVQKSKKGIGFTSNQRCHQCDQPFKCNQDLMIASHVDGKVIYRHQWCPSV